jgi:hypothetical protein
VSVVPSDANPRRILAEDLLDHAPAAWLARPFRLDRDSVSSLSPHLASFDSGRFVLPPEASAIVLPDVESYDADNVAGALAASDPDFATGNPDNGYQGNARRPDAIEEMTEMKLLALNTSQLPD